MYCTSTVLSTVLLQYFQDKIRTSCSLQNMENVPKYWYMTTIASLYKGHENNVKKKTKKIKILSFPKMLHR